jgi:hypothetical protein
MRVIWQGFGISAALLAGCMGRIGDPAGAEAPPPMPGGAPPGTLPPGAMGGMGGPTTSPPTAPPAPAGDCRVSVPLRRLTDRQYRNAVRDLFRGQVQPSARFPASELGASRSGFSTEPDANVVTLLGAENILESAEEVALAVVDRLPAVLPCAATTANESCAGSFLDDVGGRAFRRPLAPDERTLLLGVYRKATGADAFKDGIALLISAILQAPQFLYLVESGKPVPGSPDLVELSDFEVAARLSFLLWDGLPDSTLLDAAARGGLHTGKDVRAQAERMLADPRARATVVRFAREWTNLHVWRAGEKATKDFTEALATSMQSEFDLFMQGAFLDAGGTVKSLLTSPATYANATLAAYYGVPAPPAPTPADLRPVMVDARAGLLTLPAFLTSAAHGDQTSYVRRGVFVLRNLLCQDLPEPPPDAATRQPSFPANASQRQKSTAIRAVPECNVCHGLIDDIGVAFEGYDEIGRVRTTLPAAQGGGPVDQRGEVHVGVPELDGAFDGPVALSARLAASSVTRACIARQWFRFAMSRLEGTGDACALSTLTRALDGSGQSLRELILALTAADEFRFRRLGGAP